MTNSFTTREIVLGVGSSISFTAFVMQTYRTIQASTSLLEEDRNAPLSMTFVVLYLVGQLFYLSYGALLLKGKGDGISLLISNSLFTLVMFITLIVLIRHGTYAW